jgi:hypothetical protein
MQSLKTRLHLLDNNLSKLSKWFDLIPNKRFFVDEMQTLKTQ